MFSYVTPEQRVRADHPLRPIRRMTDAALTLLSSRFDRLYATTGRPSIPPEQLLRALLLQMLYSIRSERLLVEELDYSVLYRWFVGLSLDDPIWDAITFTKNRDRLLAGDIADAFFAEVLAAIKAEGLLSDEHFTVDGTLLEAWASQKSFKPKAGPRTPPDDPSNPTVNFHGQTRRNDTHQSTTDPDARLYRKGNNREAKLAYLGHLLTENRHGFIIDTAVTDASGTAERDAAIFLLGELPLTTRRLTVAGCGYLTRAPRGRTGVIIRGCGDAAGLLLKSRNDERSAVQGCFAVQLAVGGPPVRLSPTQCADTYFVGVWRPTLQPASARCCDGTIVSEDVVAIQHYLRRQS
jgi:transposase